MSRTNKARGYYKSAIKLQYLRPCVNVKKLLGRNLDFHNFKKLKKRFFLMSEPALKCENNEAIFKQNQLLLLKWPILAVSASGEI